MNYLVFLRGINVGGNKKVPMKLLVDCLLKAGFAKVKTHNNTGNVYLESETKDVKSELEKAIFDTFGFEVEVVVRSYDLVQALIDQQPFSGLDVHPDYSWNVSFLDSPSKHTFTEPQVVRQTETEICWLHKKGGHDSPFEKIFEKRTGVLVTTRTWNTVKLCVKMGR